MNVYFDSDIDDDDYDMLFLDDERAVCRSLENDIADEMHLIEDDQQ